MTLSSKLVLGLLCLQVQIDNRQLYSYLCTEMNWSPREIMYGNENDNDFTDSADQNKGGRFEAPSELANTPKFSRPFNINSFCN